jgi:hypothetical protein
MRLFLMPTIALVCCISSGCSQDSARAREAARAFLTAMNQGDSEAAKAVATQAARPNLTALLKDNNSEGSSFTLGEPKVEGEKNSAEVPCMLTKPGTKPTVGKVLLRREEKEWRVWGLRVPTESGQEVTLDLEHPERALGELFGAALGELAQGLKGLGKDAEKTGRAFGEALGGFMKGFSEGVEKTAPKEP